MHNHDDMPPEVPLTEDEMRTVARDYAEGHGADQDPEDEDILAHAMPYLQASRGEFVFPDTDSMQIIKSLVRRATLAVELPEDLHEQQVTLTDNQCRKWARFIRTVFGAGDADSDLVRRVVADAVVGELDQDTVNVIIGYCEEAEVRVKLPGDKRWDAGEWPGDKRPPHHHH